MSRFVIVLLSSVVMGIAAPAAAGDGSAKMIAEELRALGRQRLIETATERLQQRYSDFDPAPFDQVEVRASSSEVWVSFTTSIVLLRPGDRFYVSRSIELVSGRRTGRPVSHSEDVPSTRNPPPFVPDHGARAAIAFVIQAVNRSPEVGDVPEGRLSPGTSMTIRDEGDSYKVSVGDAWMDSFYRVDKQTGAISDAMHAHMAPEPGVDGEEFEVITE